MSKDKITPLKIANTFIKKHAKDEGIEHLKLQKLVYYAYGWYLAYHDQPFMDEAPQVWAYGPVFKSLYFALRSFGRNKIKEPQKAGPFENIEVVKDKQIEKLIDWIWDKYGHRSAGELSTMTHRKGTPWQIAAEKNGYKVPKNYSIEVDLIKKCFEEQKNEAAG